MKKVLFVLNNMNIGGTEKAFLNYVDTLPPEEYDVTLLLCEKSGGFLPYIPERVHVKVMDDYASMKREIMDPPLRIAGDYLRSGHICRAFWIAALHLVAKITNDRTLYYRYVLRKQPERGAYDAAIAYCGPFDFLTVYVLYAVRAAKKVQWIHFDVSKFHFNTKMCKRLYPKFDGICVVSDAAREQLLKKIPEISDKTITVPNVVSPEQCRRLAEAGGGFQDGFEGIRIVTVGRLSEEKGQDIIPPIAAKLKENGINFRWYLIGDGKLRPTIEAQCKKYGVDEEIVFLGVQANPYPYLKEADIYVQTSKHEGFCITLAEAKAFDLPIISTDCAGAHEQLDERKNCKVVKRDTDVISQSVFSVVMRDQKE